MRNIPRLASHCVGAALGLIASAILSPLASLVGHMEAPLGDAEGECACEADTALPRRGGDFTEHADAALAVAADTDDEKEVLDDLARIDAEVGIFGAQLANVDSPAAYLAAEDPELYGAAREWHRIHFGEAS